MNKKHSTKKLRVALASYDARQIRVWKHYLEEQGTELSCRGYRCGEELLLALRERERFDVVVLGSRLEDMDARMFLERAGKLVHKPFFLLMEDGGPERSSADSFLPDGPCYLIRHTSLRVLLQKLQESMGDTPQRIENICREFYFQWGLLQSDINCAYLTQAVCIACTTENKLAIRKEILRQVAEQHGMKVIAVDSGLRRLINGLEMRQTDGWKRFKRQNRLDGTTVTTGKLIYALKDAVEQY